MSAMEGRTNTSEEARTGLCLDCGATFPNQEALERHRAAAHAPAPEEDSMPRRSASPERRRTAESMDVGPPVADDGADRDPTGRTAPKPDPRMRVAEPERATEMESEGRQSDRDAPDESRPNAGGDEAVDASNRPGRPFGRAVHAGPSGRTERAVPADESDPTDRPEHAKAPKPGRRPPNPAD